MTWNPTNTLKFAGPRLQPGLDLITRLPDIEARRIVDLGCGTGALAAQLSERWPRATVTGLDRDRNALREARATHPDLEWVEGDIADWAPAEPVDVIFSNAALQWLEGHDALVPRLLSFLAPGGVLAVQMPRNFDAPSHVLMRALASESPWSGRIPLRRPPVGTPAAYYDLLAPRKRTAFHAHAAKVLAANQTDPEVVAEHLLLAGPPRDAWSVSALQEAGRSAARKGAPAAAVRYLRSALDAADAADPPPELLVDLCLAEASAGEATSLARFEQALQHIREPGRRADALYSLGQTLYRFGRYTDAGTVFRRGAALFEDGDRQVRLRFEAAAFGAEYHLPPEQHGPLSAADGTGPGDRAVLAVHSLRECLTSPPASIGADLATRALQDGMLLAELTSRSPVVSLAVLALLHSGRLVEAHEAADAVVTDARGRGAPMAYAEASLCRALVLLARGRITEAAVDAQMALDRMGWHAHARTAAATLANCMIERGELTEAASVLDRVEEIPPPVDVPGVDAYVYLARGRLHLGLRDIEAARKDLVAAEEALQVFGDANPSALPWRSLAGVIAHLGGDQPRANVLIQEEIRLAQSYEVPIALGVALRRRAMTERGQQALDTLRQAIAALETTEAKLELAHAHAGLGRGLRRAGQRVEARHHLTIGLDLAHRCGASGLEAEIRQELAAAGARPRRPALSGVESLTPTELRVAQLAAQGGSNRDIAEIIFVSRNTVAWHLRNVYRKLQIDSREQLARVVEA